MYSVQTCPVGPMIWAVGVIESRALCPGDHPSQGTAAILWAECKETKLHILFLYVVLLLQTLPVIAVALLNCASS